MPKNENTLTWRVQALERQVSSLDSKVDSLLQNCLPHIQEEITSLKTRVNVLTAVNVGAIILGLVIGKIL